LPYLIPGTKTSPSSGPPALLCILWLNSALQSRESRAHRRGSRPKLSGAIRDTRSPLRMQCGIALPAHDSGNRARRHSGSIAFNLDRRHVRRKLSTPSWPAMATHGRLFISTTSCRRSVRASSPDWLTQEVVAECGAGAPYRHVLEILGTFLG